MSWTPLTEGQTERHKQTLVLVAGGVGLNPLYSMLLTACDNMSCLRSVRLLYSVSHSDEIQFKVSSLYYGGSQSCLAC